MNVLTKCCTCLLNSGLTKNSTIDVAYNYLVYENITIDNEIASGTIKGKYEQIMHIGLVTYSYDF